MNDLKIWNYEDSTVRTVEIDSEIWFVGKDIAEILDFYAKCQRKTFDASSA